MKFTELRTMALHPAKLARAALALVVTLVLVACGGGGTTPVTDVSTTAGGQRALSSAFTTRKAVNYSPYRTATTVGNASLATDIANENITDAMVIEDLTLLQQAGFGMIRLFNSDEKVAQRTLRVISDPANGLDFKVYLGMWMAGYNEPGNQAQIALGIALAKSYPDIVVAVSVGNESLVTWSDHAMQPAVLANHIAYVRSQITQPVTTDDNWAYYAAADRVILDVIDFASVHSYAMVDTHYNPTFWDWKQLGTAEGPDRAVAMMNAALNATKKDYSAARSFIDSKGHAAMPIIVGETGWMAEDATGAANWYKFMAHPANQKMYFDRLQAWWSGGTGPKAVFYFEAFDEQWKGTDDKWGLFNKNREARFAIQSAHAASSTFKYEAGSYAQADALYYKPPTLNAAQTQTKYVIHSEAVTGWPDGLRADAFGGGTPFTLDYPLSGDSASGDQGATLDASHYIKLSVFRPLAGSYGWGLLWQSSAEPTRITANMSNFANGAIHFSVKTAYLGKLRIGISSDTDLGTVVEANLLVSSGDSYGYCSNSTAVWCDVAIPLSAFKLANPLLDLRYILTRFSIADIYGETGNAARDGMPAIELDNIYLAQ